MRIFDPKFKDNIAAYIFQSALATLAILAIVIFLNVVRYPAIIACLGASCFIAFTLPHSDSAKTRCLVGGYVVGVIVGTLCYQVSFIPAIIRIFPTARALYLGMAAASVGLAIFLMVITNTEHPPAAGLALALVLNEWDLYSVLFVLAGVSVLALLRKVLLPRLRNLH